MTVRIRLLTGRMRTFVARMRTSYYALNGECSLRSDRPREGYACAVRHFESLGKLSVSVVFHF